MKRNSNIAAANDTISIDTIPDSILKPRYECNNKGVFWIGVKTSRDGEVMEQEPIRLADPIKLIGRGKDETGNYYRIIQWRDGISRQWQTLAIPMTEIGSNWHKLKRLGLSIMAGRRKRELLEDYLQSEGSMTPYIITAQAGWAANNHAYVLPNGEIITASNNANALRIIYDGDKSQAAAYTPAGTLEEWQQQIASKAQNNSRLSLLIGTSLAAPLLPLLGMEAGGFHLFGDSKDGKTASAFAAASVWGNPEQLKVSWNGTSLAFQNIANASNHNLVYLDEIGEADPKQVAKTAYSIINGVSKAQGAKDGGNRDIYRWKILVLSTGEKPMDSYVTDGGAKWNAGQAARLASIPSYTGKGIGSYDTLHGMNTSNELSQSLYTNTAQYHGMAGRALIRLLLDQPSVIDEVKILMDNFIRLLPNMDGQAHVVALRFALVAATLELSAQYGITGLPTGNAFITIKQCFDDWLARTGIGKYEDQQILEQAINFAQQHFHSQRFALLPMPPSFPTPNDLAGYRKKNGNEDEDLFYVLPATFLDEICQSFDKNKVCEVLFDADWLKKADGKRWQHKLWGKGRFYLFAGILPPNELQD